MLIILISFLTFFTAPSSLADGVTIERDFSCSNQELREAKSNIYYLEFPVVSKGQLFTTCSRPDTGKPAIPMLTLETKKSPEGKQRISAPYNWADLKEEHIVIRPDKKKYIYNQEGENHEISNALVINKGNNEFSLSYVYISSDDFDNQKMLIPSSETRLEDNKLTFEELPPEEIPEDISVETKPIIIDKENEGQIKIQCTGCECDKDCKAGPLSEPKSHTKHLKSEQELDRYFHKFLKIDCSDTNQNSFNSFKNEYKEYFKASASHFNVPYEALVCLAFKESKFQNYIKDRNGKSQVIRNPNSGATGIGQFLVSTMSHIDKILSDRKYSFEEWNEKLKNEKQKKNPSSADINYLQQKVDHAALNKMWDDYFNTVSKLGVYNKSPDKNAYKKYSFPPTGFTKIGAGLPANAIGAMGFYLKFIQDRILPDLKELPGNKSDENFVDNLSIVSGAYHLGYGHMEILIRKSGNFKSLLKNLDDPNWIYNTIKNETSKINESRKNQYVKALSEYKKNKKNNPRLAKPKKPGLMRTASMGSIKEFIAYRKSAKNCMSKKSNEGWVDNNLNPAKSCEDEFTNTESKNKRSSK